MNTTNDTCKDCRYVIPDTDKHGDINYQCGRFPPKIINSSSPAMFPKVKHDWSCGEYKD